MNALFRLQGNRLAAASAVLSFATNVLATALIGYKAWSVPTELRLAACVVLNINVTRSPSLRLSREHRQLLREHLCEGHRQTRVLRGLALLVESGAMYSVLLVSTFSLSIVVIHPTRLGTGRPS